MSLGERWKFLFPSSKRRYSLTSEICSDRDISLLSVGVRSHLCKLGLNIFGKDVRGKWRRGQEKRDDLKKNKRAAPQSSDSNLDVNCRLMSRRCGMLLGNHSGIRENDARKTKTLYDRCTTELPLYLCYLSGTRQNSDSGGDSGARTCVIQPRPHFSSGAWPLKQEQLFLPTAHSLFFLLILALLLTYTHVPTITLIVLFVWSLFFSLLQSSCACHPSAHIAPLLGSVPPSQPQPSHLLMISLISFNCRSLTNNDPQSAMFVLPRQKCDV